MDLKTNRGVIFKNTKKENDNHPDYKGQIDCDGTKKDIALWLSESSKGTKYFSVMLSKPYEKEVGQSDQVSDQADQSGPDDDLPF